MMPLQPPHGRPFDPPDELARLREQCPVSPMTYPDGHEGWLVTSHELVRAVLADRRFSHRADLVHTPMPGAGARVPLTPAPPGAFLAMDPPEHTRYRHLLTGQFTVRRMRRLTGSIDAVVAAHLDAIEAKGPPADLVADFAQPIPGVVICELLGVPDDERERFRHHMPVLGSTSASAEDKAAAFAAANGQIAALVAAKRAHPTDDLLSGLVTGGELTDEELVTIAFVVMGGGFDTTANMLALGAWALMRRPGAVEHLLRDPDAAVEELLRYLSIIPLTARAALEDVELGGVLVRAGQTVTVSIPAANRDPAHFPDPDRLDLDRSTAGHLAFGHGIHQCLGQQLARVEMTAGLPALFARLRGLRPAVPEEEVPLRTDMMIYGLHALPVTWEAG
ncbi:cytochrome P450 [Nonomuraea sp. NPDC050790]|uniref:cytochrome P450 n=1 Tax=Nonomuraea sp. NPDC050790 TaxID=3364371 RepID=UPI0037AF5C66